MDEDIKLEDISNKEDVPAEGKINQTINNYGVDTNNIVNTKNINRDVFNTIKAHNLLGWCVGILVIIYLFELFKDNGKISAVGNDIIEIIKLLIFSLTGYLFGTNSKDNKEK